MIAIGNHKARACAAEFGTSKTKGTECVEVDFEITDGPNVGEHITYSGYFTEKTTKRTIESLRLCGCTFPGADITVLDGLGSAEVSITVEHEAYQTEHGEQKVKAKVAWVNRIGGGFFAQKMEGDARASFARRMKGDVLAVAQLMPVPKAAAAPPPKPAARPASAPARNSTSGAWDGTGPDPSDIPF